jgi:signal transduction histidine kinase
VLEGSSLPTAFERIVAQWTQSSGIRANVTATGHVQTIHPEVEVTLLRVLQEALANVRKHANAQEVSITLSYMADRVVLDVQDDGDGMIESGELSLSSSRFGLQAMRERVENLQGQIQIESEPGEGTTLVVEIPLPTVEMGSRVWHKMEVME